MLDLEVPSWGDPDLLAAYVNSRIPGHDLRELTQKLVAAGVLPGQVTTNRALVGSSIGISAKAVTNVYSRW